MNWLLLTVTVLLGVAVQQVSSQCYGLHCAGNGLGLTSSLMNYLQLGGGGLGRGLKRKRYYKRYRERINEVPEDLPPIRAAIAELEEERREALGPEYRKVKVEDDEYDDYEEYIPKRRRGGRRKGGRRNRRRRGGRRDRIVQMTEADQSGGYKDARKKVNALGFVRSNVL